MIVGRILFIETTGQKEGPIIDDTVLRLTAAIRKGSFGLAMHGVHMCSCGTHGMPASIMLENNIGVTNSHALHYLVYHRSEVPISEIEKINLLPAEFERPTEDELNCIFQL